MTTSSIVKRIVCLANSRKMSGRCIAGKEILINESGGVTGTGDWIRPVSDRPSEEVSEHERQYVDGKDPQVLDVIDVPLLNSQPKDYQQENWLIDNHRYWTRVAHIDPSQLNQFTDSRALLWTNSSSTYNGRNDRVPQSTAIGLRDSLRLLRVNGLTLSVSAPGEAFGNYRRSVQGRFLYNETDYWLRITDPNYERQYLQQPDGNYQIGECFLTISLGELYQGYSYKLIAAIIPA